MSDSIKRFQHFQYLNDKKFQVLEILKTLRKIITKQTLRVRPEVILENIYNISNI